MEINKSGAENLKILVAGCGSIGKRHVSVLNELGVSDIWVYDPVEEQVLSLIKESPGVKRCDSFEEGLLKRPDAVFILTPTRLHIPAAIQAVQANCHVFLEKPLSDTLEGVDELVRIAAEKDRKIMVGFCFRYHEGLLKAKKLVQDGRIGRLVSIRALMGEHFPEVRPDYKSTYYANYSGAFELVHDLDLAIWYADRNVKNAYAVFGAFSDIGIKAPDTVEILVEFEDRCAATVHLDFFQRPRRRMIELIGTEGVVTVEFASWEQYTLSVFDMERKEWESLTEKTTRNDMFKAEDREFLLAITENIPIRCGISDARKSLEVVLHVQNRRG